MTILNIILAALLIWLVCKYFDLKKNLKPTENRYAELVNAVTSIVDRVEGYDKDHAKEVADLSVKIARRTSASEEQITSLETAAKLHDVGMLMISNDMIKSRRKLNDDNAFIMKNHPLLAEHYLKQEVAVTDDIPTIIRWHHERWDGFGYPDSLRGEQIPVLSRIIAIADSVSSMRSSRNYRKRSYKSDKEIIEELKRQSGLQFDPALVKIAVAILEEDIKED